jgi:hypothetical protein
MGNLLFYYYYLLFGLFIFIISEILIYYLVYLDFLFQ